MEVCRISAHLMRVICLTVTGKWWFVIRFADACCMLMYSIVRDNNTLINQAQQRLKFRMRSLQFGTIMSESSISPRSVHMQRQSQSHACFVFLLTGDVDDVAHTPQWLPTANRHPRVGALRRRVLHLGERHTRRSQQTGGSSFRARCVSMWMSSA